MAIKIGLDAGHGLNTAGKQTPDGIKEWLINDKVRDKVVSFLSAYDCEFIHTDNNEGNTDESLSIRLEKYINAGVAAFVSIHHNAFTGDWNGATGVEVYTDNKPTNADLRLADCIYGRLVNNTGLKGRGIKKADFKVIKQDQIPAVLCEGGFMDGTNDYKVITSDAGQTAYAKAVAEGLIEFLGLKKKTTSTTVAKPTNPLKAGTAVKLSSASLYASASAEKASAKKSGTFYLWSDEVVNNRVRITNKKANVGVKGQVTGWVNVSAIGVTATPTAKPTAKSVTEGCKVKVNQGAKDYNGKKVASFVYRKVYTVDDLEGDRAVLDKNGICTAFRTKDLTVQ